MGHFKEHVLQEGEVWDALVHSVKKGYKAYQEKRKEQKDQTSKNRLADKMLEFKNKDELKDLVKQIVSNGYNLTKNGDIKEEPKTRPINGWLYENVQSLHGDQDGQDRSQRSGKLVHS